MRYYFIIIYIQNNGKSIIYILTRLLFLNMEINNIIYNLMFMSLNCIYLNTILDTIISKIFKKLTPILILCSSVCM